MENKPKNKAEFTFVADAMKQLSPGESKELVIRTGDAEPIHLPVKVDLSGVLSAPKDFFLSRKELHDPKKCHVTFSRSAMVIELRVDEASKFGASVKGRLETNPDLSVFQINSGNTRTIKQLLEVVRKNRYFFPDREEQIEIVSRLMNFQATVQKSIEDSNNNRGESNKSLAIKIDHKIHEAFKLQMPIFKGTESVTFRVEIQVDATDAGVVVWLESPELRELELQVRDSLIEKNIADFIAAGVVVIEQ